MTSTDEKNRLRRLARQARIARYDRRIKGLGAKIDSRLPQNRMVSDDLRAAVQSALLDAVHEIWPDGRDDLFECLRVWRDSRNKVTKVYYDFALMENEKNPAGGETCLTVELAGLPDDAGGLKEYERHMDEHVDGLLAKIGEISAAASLLEHERDEAAKSAKKAAASRANGKRGERPTKAEQKFYDMLDMLKVRRPDKYSNLMNDAEVCHDRDKAAVKLATSYSKVQNLIRSVESFKGGKFHLGPF